MAKLSNINGKFAVEDTGAIRFSDQTGTTGQILKSNGNSAPTWVDPNTVGTGPWLPLAGGVVSGATTFQSSLTVGGTISVNATTSLLLALNSTNTNGGYLRIMKSGATEFFIGTRASVSGTSGTGYDIYTIAGNDLRFFTNGTNLALTIDTSQNVGIGTTGPDGKLEVAGGTTLGLRLSNAGDSSAYDQVRMTYGGYNSGAPTVTFMPLTTPGGGNVDTTFLFQNTNGINASSNNNANVAIDGTLQVGRSKGLGETTLIMNNYDTSLAGTNQIQNSIRMSGRYWSGSASQLVETRINSVHQESDGNGGSALTFMTQTGGSAVVEQMRIDKVGNVGIGTNSPSERLSVDGNAEILKGDDARVYIKDVGDSSTILLRSDGVNTSIGTDSNHDLQIQTNGSTKMYIESGGNVGIGTNSPTQPLDVNGYSICDKQFQRDNSTTIILGTPRILNIGYQGSSGTYDFNPVTLFGNNAQGGQCEIQVTGWQNKVNNGFIYWRDNGSNTNIGNGLVGFVQTAVVGSGVISVSTNAGGNVITITFTGWHSNSHGWNAKIISNNS